MILCNFMRRRRCNFFSSLWRQSSQDFVGALSSPSSLCFLFPFLSALSGLPCVSLPTCDFSSFRGFVLYAGGTRILLTRSGTDWWTLEITRILPPPLMIHSVYFYLKCLFFPSLSHVACSSVCQSDRQDNDSVSSDYNQPDLSVHHFSALLCCVCVKMSALLHKAQKFLWAEQFVCLSALGCFWADVATSSLTSSCLCCPPRRWTWLAARCDMHCFRKHGHFFRPPEDLLCHH